MTTAKPERAHPFVRLDLDALHWILRDRANARGKLEVSQRELADELGVTEYTMSRCISKLVEDGKVRRLGRNGRHNLLVISDLG